MTRGKPLILSRKPGSAAREQRKRAAESSFSSGALPKNPPGELAGMKQARRAWREVMQAHDQLPGELFNALDRGFLIGYCLARQARQDSLELAAQLTKDYKAGIADLKGLIAVRVELRQATRLVADLEKQLYGTPKARAGVSPSPRELTDDELVDQELSEVDKMLLEREGE
jgi:hypothetical protein